VVEGDRVVERDFVFGAGADGRMISSPGGPPPPPPPPPPPAAKADIAAGVAMSAPTKTVSIINLIDLVMHPSCVAAPNRRS
jgi:hypothetical protein